MSELVTFLKPDFSFADERGSLVQLAHSGWKQINVLHTKAGVKRGGHNEDLIVKSGDFFCFPPYVVHSLEFRADTTLVALYDTPVEQGDGTKDIFAAEE